MKTIQEIREEFEKASVEDYAELYARYQEDERKGVVQLIAKHRKIEEKLEQEKKRIYRMQEFERKYGHKGLLCGVDDVGRGPLAGPVAAGAVILPPDCQILYLNDSKKLAPQKREELYSVIMDKAVAVGIGWAGPERIDEINILQAAYEAMRQAVENLQVKPQVLLNDAVTIPHIEIEQVPIVHGDARSLSIAAASVVAKVSRDRLMLEYDKEMPQYGFASHKGYGSAAHYKALRKYGPSPIHRKSFLRKFEHMQAGNE